MTNQEEVELRSKIEALGLEVTKVPSKSTHSLDEVYIFPGPNPELFSISQKLLAFVFLILYVFMCYQLEIARELDKLSAKLDGVDEMISSAMAADPQVQSLLSGTADVWMPVITANADERCNLAASISTDNPLGNNEDNNKPNN